MLVNKAAVLAVGHVRGICQLRHVAHSAVATVYPISSAYPAPGAQGQQAARSFARVSGCSRGRFVVACASETNTVELEVKVEGMKCGGCSSRVEAALKAMDHVKGVQVDLDTKLATVEVEAPNLIDAMNMLPNFVKTIKELGFEAEPHIEYQA